MSMITPIPEIIDEIRDAFDEDVRESLQLGHDAFIRALNTHNFEVGKVQLAEALLICPTETTWTLFAVIYGLADEINGTASAVLAMTEWLNFMTLPYMARDLALAQIGFRNRYRTSEGFLSELGGIEQFGLTDSGWSFHREHPNLFGRIGEQIINYGEHATECGNQQMGKLIHILGVSIRDCIKKP